MLFIAGLFLSLLGSLPPGLISLAVANTAVRRTLHSALTVAVGAAIGEFFQAWAAIALTGWMVDHPTVQRIFELGTIPVFFALGIYLFFFPGKPAPQRAVFGSRIWKEILKGLFISWVNLLAIPYWLAYCAWLHLNGWWTNDSLSSTLLFAAGVMVGTYVALALYAFGARWLVSHSEVAARYANRAVAVIFWSLAVWSAVKTGGLSELGRHMF